MAVIKEQTLNDLETLIIEIVSTPAGTWREKREIILQGLSEEGKSDLEEFVAWFDES